MTTAIIHLAPRDTLRFGFLKEQDVQWAKDNFERFTEAKRIETEMSGQDAAEEMFDLTNNPSRQEEREEKYGRGPSLSSGDVVEVEGVLYLCMSFGWRIL